MPEITWEKVFVTPEIANGWLKTNPRNRTIKATAKNKLVTDMKNGEWVTTHQGIAISPSGKLLDGHHRLEAVAESGIACWMWVAFNAPETSKIDHSVPRSDRDSMYMASVIDKGSIEYNILTYPLIGYMVALGDSLTASRAMTAEKKHEIYKSYNHLIDPVIRMANSFQGTKSASRGRSAAVLYAMVCALNSNISEETVRDWYRILMTGDFYKEGDDYQTKVGRSVLIWKNTLENTNSNGDSAVKYEVFRKSQSSLYHFAEKHVITKLYGMIAFPLVYKKEE